MSLEAAAKFWHEELTLRAPTIPELWAFDIAGITQRAVADLLGVTPALISQWKRGRRPVPQHQREVMHALLRDLGAVIVRQGNNIEPLRRTIICKAIQFATREASHV